MTRDEAISLITDRLVEYYEPDRIYLFGSVARGDDAVSSPAAVVTARGDPA